MAVGVAKTSSVSQSSIASSKIALQAQQYAGAKAELVKAEKYSDLAAQTKTKISNSDTFYDEVLVGDEQDYSDNDKIQQKEITINVYNSNESLPRATLKFNRYSVSMTDSVPQGTILPWYGKLDEIPNGFYLCDGQNGTPDLRNRFLVGAGDEYKLSDKGGEKEVTLEAPQIGSHYHGVGSYNFGSNNGDFFGLAAKIEFQLPTGGGWIGWNGSNHGGRWSAPSGAVMGQQITSLAVVLILAVVSSLMSVGTAKITQAAINSTGSNKVTLQAQQYATSEAELIKAIKYDELASESKTAIADSDYQKEITISDESDYSDTIKQKTATVKIYKSQDTLPRAELKVTRYSVEQKAGGVPIGTIIAWASSINPADGTWLECNGQSCASYSELVAVLGKSTVPDYRGVFLRGLGSVQSTHYGTVTHSSNALGIIQGDAMRSLPTSYFYAALGRVGSDYGSDGYECSGAFTYIEKYSTAMKTGNGDDWGRKYKLDFSGALPVANEFRPVNIAVRYFIKAA